MRPLPRRSVLALHEAASREGPANQRWYRVDLTPSVHVDRGCFFTETEYERRAARRGALCVFGADGQTNQTLYRKLQTLEKRRYRCLLYCNESMPVTGAGRAVCEDVDGYTVALERL